MSFVLFKFFNFNYDDFPNTSGSSTAFLYKKPTFNSHERMYLYLVFLFHTCFFKFRKLCSEKTPFNTWQRVFEPFALLVHRYYFMQCIEYVEEQKGISLFRG